MRLKHTLTHWGSSDFDIHAWHAMHSYSCCNYYLPCGKVLYPDQGLILHTRPSSWQTSDADPVHVALERSMLPFATIPHRCCISCFREDLRNPAKGTGLSGWVVRRDVHRDGGMGGGDVPVAARSLVYDWRQGREGFNLGASSSVEWLRVRRRSTVTKPGSLMEVFYGKPL